MKYFTKGIIVAVCCGFLFASCEKEDLLEPSAILIDNAGSPDAGVANMKSANQEISGQPADGDPIYTPTIPSLTDHIASNSFKSGDDHDGHTFQPNLTVVGSLPVTVTPVLPGPQTASDVTNLRSGDDIDQANIQTNFSFANVPFQNPTDLPTPMDASNRSINIGQEPDCGYPVVKSIPAMN